MKFVTLTSLPDEGVGAMVRDALADRDIPARLRPRRADGATLGLFVKELIDVQVPAEREAEARLVLASLEQTLFQPADAFAQGEDGVEPWTLAGDDPAGAAGHEYEDDGDLAARPRHLGTALVLAVLCPVPVVCLYAGARQLGRGLAALALVLVLLLLLVGQPQSAWRALVILKGVDLLLALPRLLDARTRPGT